MDVHYRSRRVTAYDYSATLDHFEGRAALIRFHCGESSQLAMGRLRHTTDHLYYVERAGMVSLVVPFDELFFVDE